MELNNFNNFVQSFFYNRFETVCVIIIEIITCQKRNQHHKLCSLTPQARISLSRIIFLKPLFIVS